MTPPSDAMLPAPDAPARRSRVVFLVAVWTLLATLSTLQAAATRSRAGFAFHWPALIANRFADWYSCALFTPAYFWLARHAPITRRTWTTGVAAHLGATAVFVVIKYMLFAASAMALGAPTEGRGYGAMVRELLLQNFIYESMILWAVAGVVHAIEFYKRAQEREAHASHLRAELSAAQLSALSAQLQPHFLFNALNSVSALMHRDIEAADRMLASLGDLLRRTLRAGASHEVSLREELALLDAYLAIVGVRFRDRLRIEVTADPELLDALVPHFVLQPLVENALEHGIARRAGPGCIEVRAAQEGAELVLSVSDDGAGRHAAGIHANRNGNGIGLENTRRRLTALYGSTQRLTVGDRDGGGFTVTVVLPLHRSALMPT